MLEHHEWDSPSLDRRLHPAPLDTLGARIMREALVVSLSSHEGGATNTLEWMTL